MKRKHDRGEPITPEQDRAYVHAALSNGYGDEAVFGTEPERRGDGDDIRKAKWHMETQWDFDRDRINAFIANSIKETRKVLSDPRSNRDSSHRCNTGSTRVLGNWEVDEQRCRERSLESKRRGMMETQTHYHEEMMEMIAENLKEQGYTKEELKQYNMDRDNGISETDAMKRLHRSRGCK